MNEKNLVGLEEILNVLEGAEEGQREIEGLQVTEEVIAEAKAFANIPGYKGNPFIESREGYALEIVNGQVKFLR